MEKRKYNKPEVTNTELDSTINMVLMSANQTVPDPNPGNPPNEAPVNSGIFNPFKWFK